MYVIEPVPPKKSQEQERREIADKWAAFARTLGYCGRKGGVK
jgi:hypothetical protein